MNLSTPALRRGAFVALALLIIPPASARAADLLAYWEFDDASAPSSTADSVAARTGSLQGGAVFTADGGGRSGAAGDRGLDFGADNGGQTVNIADGAFINTAAATDQLTVSFWQRLSNTGNSSTFWFASPSSTGNQRGMQIHLPWGDGTIYYDSAGCCGAGTQRSTANPPPVHNWTTWHHYAVVKNGGTKQVWIDGDLVLDATGADPLPSDFSEIWLGSEFGNNSLQGVLDDFAVFGNALTEAEIGVLAGGASAFALTEVNTDLPSLTVSPASAVGAGGATLNGEVTEIGIDAPAVTFYYGDEDGGQDTGAWDSSVTLPGTHSGAFAQSVTGLAPATSYFFGARATNSEGSRWAIETESFTTLPLAPAVQNVAATEVQASSATVGATVTATGGEAPTVTIYYGTADEGTGAGAWQASTSLGVTATGGTAVLSGLASGTTYHYRAFASNGGGDAWAGSSSSFTTAVATPASVVNRAADRITGSTARLRGTVTDAGSDPPSLTFYYGTVDAGTDKGEWQLSASAGTDSGDFSKTVSLLAPETLYHFRAHAANGAGESWAPSSESFTTTTAAALGVVINEVHHDADPKTEPAEFVELWNAGDVSADLSGWRLEGVGDYVFPGGSTLAAGQFLVVAENTATMQSKFGVTTTHQYGGRLNNDGDDLRLLDAGGGEVDRVDYKSGFPWPTAARGTGASMELIHPQLDNQLGGSWRSSGAAPVGPIVTFVPAGSSWSYRKGTSEASNPVGAWRELVFTEDASWLAGDAVIGYGDGDDITVLDDMQSSYSTVYLRKTFTVPAAEIPARLLVRVYVDDGAIVWINGVEVARVSVSAGAKAFDDFGTSHERAWEEVLVNNASNVLVGGTNVVAVHALNATFGSSDFSIDCELKTPDPSSSTGEPSPGAPNSVAATTASAAPPAIRQVQHTPERPAGGQSVIISAKVTDPDGVGPVTLSYQLVDPGAYIRRSDAAYDTSWTDVLMSDNGTGGDLLAGDSIYSATMPPALQVHRRLVRYRITVEDAFGSNVRVPYADDESPNFAYLVYDSVPAWTGARQPGVTAPQTITADVMGNSLPVYHLVANSTDVSNSQWSGGSDGVRMWGTMVYEGVVYDHIQFYNRGEASTYVSGKNKWRFKFNRTRDFEARDIYGQRYKTTWKTLNFNACASPWVAANRGIAGLDEAVPHRLFQLAGVPSSNTHWVHFRVVDSAAEAPASQFDGDLWGLYLAIEHPDGRFLTEHDLPDGNVYKIQGGGGNKKNQGPTQPESSTDWNTFWNASANLNTVAWWRANFDLDSFYSFRAINRTTGNVDLRDTTNYYMYHHTDDRWRVMPWDLDMMYAPVKHVWSGVIRADRCLDHTEIRTEFRNRCREIGDLLLSDIDRHGGQAAQVVEELSQVINPTGVPLTMVDADEYMWGYHPRTAGSHRGPWYQLSKNETRLQTSYVRTIPTADHEGFQQNIIDYMNDTRPGGGFAVNDRNEDGYGYGFVQQEAADAAIPNKPTISYSGDAGFPASGLRFTSGAFSDPQGAGSFGSMQWRVGEISNPSTPGYIAGDPWVYEIEPRWESGVIAPFAAEVAVPTSALRPGRTYRARVRHLDNTGRASNWSEPVQFVVAEPDVTLYRDGLVVSEIMYHPVADAPLEFVELHNVSGAAIDLSGVRFTKGVDFDFPDAMSIPAGGYLVVVADLAAFEAEYGAGLPVAGQWQLGDNLGNGGETLKLSLGAGTAIHEFGYSDDLPWPTGPDGGGYSLTLACVESGVDHADPASWRSSVATGGSPGVGDGIDLFDWLASHGLAAGQELSDLDGDGLEAIVEYALGGDPTVGDAGIAPTTSAVAGFLDLVYRRNKAADGVVLVAEFSSDLVTWVSSGLLVSIATGGEPGIELATIRSPLPIAGNQRQFARLRVVTKP